MKRLRAFLEFLDWFAQHPPEGVGTTCKSCRKDDQYSPIWSPIDNPDGESGR